MLTRAINHINRKLRKSLKIRDCVLRPSFRRSYSSRSDGLNLGAPFMACKRRQAVRGAARIPPLPAVGASKGSRLPSVNIQESALNVIGQRRSQKRHRPSDFNRLSEPRNARRQPHRARGILLFDSLFGG